MGEIYTSATLGLVGGKHMDAFLVRKQLAEAGNERENLETKSPLTEVSSFSDKKVAVTRERCGAQGSPLSHSPSLSSLFLKRTRTRSSSPRDIFFLCY